MPLSTQQQQRQAPLGRLLYVSALAEDVPVTEVSRIVGAARVRNAEEAISGLLIFSGDAFCQYVEGPLEAVQALLRRLKRDPRHTEVQILVHDASSGSRRFSDWRLGYVDSFETDELDALRGLEGEAALAYLESMLPRLDIET